MLIYKKLFSLLTIKERLQIPVLLFLMLGATLLEIVGIGLVVPVIAIMTKPNLENTYPQIQPLMEALGGPSQIKLVMMSLIALLVVYFVKTAFLIFMLSKQNKFLYGVQANLSKRLFVGYLQQPWAFHLQRNSSRLILNATQEVNLFIANALQPIMTILTESFVLLGITALLFVLQPLGTFITISLLGGAGLISQRIVRGPLLHWGQARQHHEGCRIQHLQQGLGGAKDVKLLGRESDFIALYDFHNTHSAKVSRKQKILLELPKLWLELLAIIGLAVLIATMIMQGNSLDNLLLTLSIFTAGAFRLILVSNRILSSFQSLRYGLPIIHTLEKEMHLIHVTPTKKQSNLLAFEQKIVLEHVSYQYENTTTFALQDINLVIPIGSCVGFVGTSGAGKSTLVDIILGLLSPNQGQIKIDGIDIQTNLRGWQDQIGYVPQTIFLTDDTLRRNIAFGISEEKIDEAAIKKAIALAQLEEFVRSLPQGLETVVGERGVRLSGGQRQRIGIARALYHEPKVLVLDEATSALDTQTEKDVMAAVDALHGTKTILIVAHRLTTVKKCDILYRMENGQIITVPEREEISVNS